MQTTFRATKSKLNIQNKTKQPKQRTLYVITRSNKTIKNKRSDKKIIIIKTNNWGKDIFCLSKIYMVFSYNNSDRCVTQVKHIYVTEITKVEVYASFCYSIVPLNLSDFKMNLIVDSNKLQFCLKFSTKSQAK